MKLTNLKKFTKKLIGFVAVAAVTSLALFPAFGMRAQSPRFNFMNGDWELLSGANTSRSETIWKDPISASDGETIEGLIYYHNGILDSVAENTRVKVVLPSSLQNNSALITASISADNTQTITDTVVENKIIGKSGLTVSLDQEAELQYIPGSVKWYPNSKSNPETPSPLPFGQNGSEIFSANGLNLGNINGCWEYAGFVKFALKVKAPELVSNIRIDKTVKNLGNTADYSESTELNIGESASFKINVSNTGETIINDAIISDVLPSQLTFVADSGKMLKDGIESSIDVVTLLSKGINIGSLAVGKSVQITFSAKNNYQTAVDQIVVNTAYVTSGELNKNDTANVILKAGKSNIINSKSAYNVTQHKDATVTLARPNDEIEYFLTTRNTGNIDVNYVIKDGVADVLEYADIVSISDGGELIKNIGTGNDLHMVKYPEMKVMANTVVVVNFKVKVKNPLPNNPQNVYSYDYKMFNQFGNNVVVEIEKPAPPVLKPVLTIDKLVRNISSNELEYTKTNSAYAGDLLEYKILFKNIGQGHADYVKVWDVLPANVSLDKNAAAILGYNGQERSIAENITYGYILNTLAPGEEAYIRFRTVVSSEIAAGETLNNTAYLDDDGAVITSQSQTVIKQKVVPVASVKTLPRTGSASSLLFTFALSAMLTLSGALAYQRIKK